MQPETAATARESASRTKDANPEVCEWTELESEASGTSVCSGVLTGEGAGGVWVGVGAGDAGYPIGSSDETALVSFVRERRISYSKLPDPDRCASDILPSG